MILLCQTLFVRIVCRFICCFSTAVTGVVAMGMIFLLAACAEQEAFRRGQGQLAARQPEAALASFMEASRLAPNNAEYRSAVKNTNTAATDQLMAEATRLRTVKPTQPERAADLYRRVLMLDPTHERAIEGLQAIETARRLQRLMDEASHAATAGRDQEARAKFNKLLREDPTYTAARQALQTLDDKAGHTGSLPVLHPTLQKPVSLVFRDVTLKMVFDALSDKSGINFVFDRDVKSDTRITVFLHEVPFDEALSQITSANGLARRIVNANTLLIYPARPDKLREYQDLTVRNFFVANADVKQLSLLLRTVLKVKDLYTDEKRNLIVLRDSPEQIALAEKIIAAHDQPEPEVMLEVEILEYNHTSDNNIGIKFPDQVAFGIASPITLNALRAINDTAINVTGLDPTIALNLKRQLGDINILANPRIRVRNREKAKFHIGDKVPVITSTTYPGTTTGATSSSVSYLDVGIKLEFEPAIQLDDDVVIKTTLEVSSITNTIVNAGTTAYQVGTRNASTTLTLRDGETQVLAGLLSSDESNTSNRLPGLGDVPILGSLFGSHASKGGRKEILLSITPRIVRNLHRPTDDLLEFNFGPEAANQGASGPIGTLPSAPMPRTFPVHTPAGVSVAPSGLTGGAAALQTPPATSSASSSSTPLVPVSPVAPASSMPDFELPPGVGSR